MGIETWKTKLLKSRVRDQMIGLSRRICKTRVAKKKQTNKKKQKTKTINKQTTKKNNNKTTKTKHQLSNTLFKKKDEKDVGKSKFLGQIFHGPVDDTTVTIMGKKQQHN